MSAASRLCEPERAEAALPNGTQTRPLDDKVVRRTCTARGPSVGVGNAVVPRAGDGQPSSSTRYSHVVPGDGTSTCRWATPARVVSGPIDPMGIREERSLQDRSSPARAWARELAPSDELRTWHAHAPERFEEFARRYRGELAVRRGQLRALHGRSRPGTVTIVFAARDVDHSNAAVLADVLRRGLP